MDVRLTGTLLEKDLRRVETFRCADKQSKPFEEVILQASEEIMAVFSKRDAKVAATAN